MVKRSNNLFKKFGLKVKSMVEKAVSMFKPKKPTEPQQVKTKPDMPDIFKDMSEDLAEFDPDLLQRIQDENTLIWYHTRDYYDDIEKMSDLALNLAAAYGLKDLDINNIRRKSEEAMTRYVQGHLSSANAYSKSAAGANLNYVQHTDGADMLSLLGDLLKDASTWT